MIDRPLSPGSSTHAGRQVVDDSTHNQRLACIRSFFTYAAAAERRSAIYLADLAAIPRLNGPARHR